MVSISPDLFQQLLDNEMVDDITDDAQIDAGFGD